MIEITIPPATLLDEHGISASLLRVYDAVGEEYRATAGWLLHPDFAQVLGEDRPLTRTLIDRPVEVASGRMLGWLGPAVAVFGRPLTTRGDVDACACLIVEGAPRSPYPTRDDELRRQALTHTRWATRGNDAAVDLQAIANVRGEEVMAYLAELDVIRDPLTGAQRVVSEPTLDLGTRGARTGNGDDATR